MRTVIAAGSPMCYNTGLARAASDCDVFICADFGIRRAIEIGRRPDYIVGDFDSAAADDLALFENAPGVTVIRRPREKDETDLELCVRHAAQIGANRCEIYGATGGRADLALANIHTLQLAEKLGMEAAIIDEEMTVFAVIGGKSRVIDGDEGDIVSIIPLTESVADITTKGLKFPLLHEALIAGYTRGVSNVIETKPCVVTIGSGAAAVFVTPTTG